MKSLFLSILLFGASLLVDDEANIHFDTLVLNYGTVNEGDDAIFSFRFSNTGGAPLIIQDVETPCGCTVPEFPKHPIAPGDTGIINIIYHSKGKVGRFDKSLTVVSNAKDGAIRLRITGKVVQKP
ncbi:MAG: DUF1573 domain-containing protein [Bacteroidota bacterium]|nr:DUF1573 domain-containing protein [Bacteroidota bacterium]MDX5431536.1 DUF1573 domain-containing protein [Bacteroidota bacterium]MDX5470257.1 DUF1573 domain-containing protein [Bacteroidota bacterium]